METDHKLPDEDPDARLAKGIGEALGRNELDAYLSSSADPLASSVRSVSASSGVGSNDVESRAAAWNAIAEGMAADSPQQRPRLTLVKPQLSLRRWSIAASFVLAALIGVFALSVLKEASPTVVASTQSESRSVTLVDGSVVVLRQYSSLIRLDSSETEVVYDLDGEASFDVAHDERRRFVVKAGEGTVSVLGTSFVVSTWGNETRVFLAEGSVRLEGNSAAQAVVLEPGQESVVDNNGLVVAPHAVDEGEYLDWLADSIVFEERQIRLVIAEFSHHFGVDLHVPVDLGLETITGVIDLSTIENGIRNLEVVLGGSFDKIGSSEYAFVQAE